VVTKNRIWPEFKEDPQGYVVWGCLHIFLRYGLLIIFIVWLLGSIFGKPNDNKQPTPIPVVVATEKPRLLTMHYEQTADADQAWKYIDEGSKFDFIDTNGCPEGCTYHKDGCDIKGNISYNTSEKIYHIPGQEYYSDTVIDTNVGERWFCTESKAIENGWRKSYK
jgi:hypothetical protein